MKYISILFSLILFICCTPNNSVNLEIIAESDTVKIGQVYRAEFQLDNFDYSENVAEHYVINSKPDTLRIGQKKGRGQYVRQAGLTPKEVKFNGFVVFWENEKKQTIFYEKTFYVIK